MIEVGEYFRCKKFGSIGKYLDSFYGGTEFNVNCEPNYTFVYHSKEDFISSIKHSKNIVDLVEVGDIINQSERIIDITGDYILTTERACCKSRFEKTIKSILTHEQYKQNCYKLKE